MPFPPSHLSDHARERLLQRFKILPQDLLRLLNAGLGKKLGVSVRSHLGHRLVWSHVDDGPLVAVQDVVTGTILTVLTVDMYRRDYESNLTEKSLRRAINQMVYAGLAPMERWMPGDTPTVFVEVSSSARSVALGRWRGLIESADLSELGRQEAFWMWIAQAIADRGHRVETIQLVSARFSGGELQQIPYRSEPHQNTGTS